MEKTIKHSLTLTIGLVVILIETAAFFAVGYFYTQRFSAELDAAAWTKVQLPGILMNRQLLRYESVADANMMTELTGGEFVDGMVVGADGNVYYARDPLVVGRNVRDLDDIDARLFTVDNPQLEPLAAQPDGNHYRVSVTPIRAFENAKPFFYAYVKVKTNAVEAKKRDIAKTFVAGSLLCVVFSSLVLIVFTRRYVIRPLARLAGSADRLAEGELDTAIPLHRDDEIGTLARSFDAMRHAIREKITQLEGANRRLTELDGMKSAFLSSVSHELRTPLTSILGYAKLIAKNFEKHFLPAAADDAKLAAQAGRIRQNLKIIQLEGERLGRMINDVLDLHKIESGHMVWHFGAHAPAELAAAAATVAAALFNVPPHPRLVLAVAPDLPLVRADPDRIHQVLINLLANASKFAPWGTVTLRASTPQPGWVLFEVSDTGVGIPAGDIPKLFSRFQQLGNRDTLTEKPQGTGLGLAICKEIVEHHGGRIRAESTPSQGSLFAFTLPAAPAKESQTPQPPTNP
ncbi:HAMP domain-containing protein [Desulfovibrio aerotolerans]|uniref:histidine kinase n=1 Tax=Solidesulfovibrio aerotolerans TaxID=295255 RepID=A0A7C9N4D7_9BACT|nr:HAMP domain-containing sensor histidine kinase [Solidesulfovibrio aerotolerans]MYL82335.1 HAMP domain-containing protein [Solidesulfovibrio aerotolerans]